MFRMRGIPRCLYDDKSYLVVRRKLIKHTKEASLFRNISHEYGRMDLTPREDTEAGAHSLSTAAGTKGSGLSE